MWVGNDILNADDRNHIQEQVTLFATNLSTCLYFQNQYIRYKKNHGFRKSDTLQTVGLYVIRTFRVLIMH